MNLQTGWKIWAGFAACLIGLAAPAVADEPAGLKLLRPDSLSGWDYAAQPPAHWVISQGQLTGTADSTPLLSGFTVDEFELRFEWSTTPGGAWRLSLPDVPTGAGLSIAIKEGEGSGAIRDGERTLAPGKSVEALASPAVHTAQIRRFGQTLAVIVDGRLVSEVELDPNRRFGLALSVPEGEATLREFRLQEPRGNPLNNGRDFTGWFVNNSKGTWAVDNGDFIPTSHTGLHYLRTDKEYANFTLSLEYTISRGGNSGLAIRTAKDGWPSGDGMELQILDRPGEVKDSTMAIYGNLPPLDRADRSEAWNQVVVKADGSIISVWVNGELVQHANTARLSELKHRHLKGWIGLQDHGGKVRFRKVYVHEAPDGLGLDEWYQPRSESGAGLVLDRVMNSEQLSRVDGLGSGLTTAAVPKGGEHVLAELTGPGALVSCWSTFPSGQLSIYFDGESEPRIRCATEHLADHVPAVAHETAPALFCLPFAKSLKVVVNDSLEANYRLEHVTFPAGVPCESFSERRPGVPRGMLAAITYRHQGTSGGKLREAEIHSRVASQPRTIEPGTTVELAKLDGAGLVNWLRLTADEAVLKSDDLWLEVTVDGESLPSIAAPARFIYPGFARPAARDFSSLVLTRKDGVASLLSMPFGAGLTVAARNRGDKPIENVAVSMSVEQATDKNRADLAGRMRLCGIYQPAGSAGTELVRQAGSGRWVGFVYQQADETETGIAALEVDGTARDGWAMRELDAFFGRPGEGENFFTALAGRQGELSWRYLLLAPVTFEQSLVVKANDGDKVGGRLALFYLKK